MDLLDYIEMQNEQMLAEKEPQLATDHPGHSKILAIHVDLETTSKAKLTGKESVGAWAYSKHPTTNVWCMCWRYVHDRGQPVQVWQPGDDVPTAFFAPFTLVAHNYAFEEAIWENIMAPRYGFYIPDDYECTMAMAARLNLPMALANVAQALGLVEQKDKEASKLMVKMANASTYNPDKPGSAAQKDHASNLETLIEYCKQDVRTEAAVYDQLHAWLSGRVPPGPPDQPPRDQSGHPGGQSDSQSNPAGNSLFEC